MSLDDAFNEIIEALSQQGEAYVVSWPMYSHWPEGGLKILCSMGLLHKAKRAHAIQCNHCNKDCTINVHLDMEGNIPIRASALCGDSDMQEEMGILHFTIDQLKQWKITTLQLAKVVHRLLGIITKFDQQPSKDFIKIGFIKGDEGRRALTLHSHPLRLEINGHTLSITDVCYFNGDELEIDIDRFESCANKPAKEKKQHYQKSNKKQQARKLGTEARNKDMQEAHTKLRKQYPRSSLHTDEWIAKQIQKQGLGENIKTGTIIRIMNES